MNLIAQKQLELKAKQDALATALNSKKNATGQYELTTAEVEDFRAKNVELDDLAKEIEGLAFIDELDRRVKAASTGHQPFNPANPPIPGTGQPNPPTVDFSKGIGKLFTESDAFRKYSPSEHRGPDVEIAGIDFKTVMTTSAGFAPQAIRTGLVVPSAQRQPAIVDVIPMGRTDQNAFLYMEETTFTNNAAETAEGGDYPEGALAFTERTSAIRKIAVFIPVTDEQMEDVAGIETTVNQRLTLMLRQRLDLQLVSGNGTAPNLRGMANVSGIQTQAKSTDPVPDAIYKAMTKIRAVAFAEPGAVLIHPNDWQDIRLLRTADGIYIWGNPSEAGPERIWGLPVIASTALTENTAIVGDFANFTTLVERAGISFQVSNAHSDYFIKGQLAIRAQMRAAFAVTRPAAICTVTGI